MTRIVRQAEIEVSPIKRISIKLESIDTPQARLKHATLIEQAMDEGRMPSEERADTLAKGLGGFLSENLTKRELTHLVSHLNNCLRQF